MSQIFVPSVSLNQQQAIAQNNAQVNVSIPNQISPQNSLQDINSVFSTLEKRLGTIDSMQLQAESLRLRDDFQQRLSENRDLLLQKRGKAALDFKQEYEQLNAKAYQEVSNSVEDYRVRGIVKNAFDHTLSTYQDGANSYLSQQTAQLALDQAKASVQNASSNLIDQTVAGTPQQKQEALKQLNDETDHLTYLAGGDPNGEDGKFARQQNHDAVAKGIVSHYIKHEAYTAGDDYLASIGNHLTSATRLELADDLYLARQKSVSLSASSVSGQLPNRASWVKQTASDLFNQGLQEATDEQRADPIFVQALQANCIAKANSSFDDLQKRYTSMQNTDAAMEISASKAYAYAVQNNSVLGSDVPLSQGVQDNPTDVLSRLPKELQNYFVQKHGGVDQANAYLLNSVLPADGLLAGYEAYNGYLAHPEKLRSQYKSLKDLRAGLVAQGMGLPLINKLEDAYNNANKDFETKQNANIVAAAIQNEDFMKGALSDRKAVDADPKLQALDFSVSNRAQQILIDLHKAYPKMTDSELISQLTFELENDATVKNEFVQSNNISEKLDNLRGFNDQLSKYSLPFLHAVKNFYPNEFAAAIAGDIYTGAAQIENLAVKCLKNDKFKKAYSMLPEVFDADSYLRWSKVQEEEADNSVFSQDLAAGLTLEEQNTLKNSSIDPAKKRRNEE